MLFLQGRVFDFAVTDVAFPVVLMIILRRPSAAACARLVRWQLMHRWPGASAQFEHLWGQRIGILSMYDSRANGLLRLLGMKLPSPGWSSSAWSGSGLSLTRRSLSRFPFSELERGGHPKMSVCDELFVSLQCLCVWLALHVAMDPCLVCVFYRHISVISLQCCKMQCNYVGKSSHGFLSLRRETCFYPRAWRR